MKVLSGNNQDAAYQRQDDGGDQGVVTLELYGLKSSWLAQSGVFSESVASNRCCATRVSFSQVCWTDGHRWVDPQALGINSVCGAVGEGFLGLTPAGTWSSPSTDISIASLDAQRVFGIDSLDLSPTKCDGFGGVNDGQSFIKEDYLRSSVSQIGQESQGDGYKGHFSTGSNRTGVPRTDIHSENEEIESPKSNQARFWSKYRRIAQASHVAIVSQKVDN